MWIAVDLRPWTDSLTKSLVRWSSLRTSGRGDGGGGAEGGGQAEDERGPGERLQSLAEVSPGTLRRVPVWGVSRNLQCFRAFCSCGAVREHCCSAGGQKSRLLGAPVYLDRGNTIRTPPNHSKPPV